MLSPIECPPASNAPLFAASMMPGPPPVMMVNPHFAASVPKASASSHKWVFCFKRAEPNTVISREDFDRNSNPSTNSAIIRKMRQVMSLKACVRMCSCSCTSTCVGGNRQGSSRQAPGDFFGRNGIMRVLYHVFDRLEEGVLCVFCLCGEKDGTPVVVAFLKLSSLVAPGRVGLVKHVTGRDVLRAELSQDVIDDSNFLFALWVGDVDHVQEQVGMSRLAQRGAEGLDELWWEVLDKADGVGRQNKFLAVREIDLSGARVQGRKQLVRRVLFTSREHVEESCLACIGVADNRRSLKVISPAIFSLFGAHPLNPLDVCLSNATC